MWHMVMEAGIAVEHGKVMMVGAEAVAQGAVALFRRRVEVAWRHHARDAGERRVLARDARCIAAHGGQFVVAWRGVKWPMDKGDGQSVQVHECAIGVRSLVASCIGYCRHWQVVGHSRGWQNKW